MVFMKMRIKIMATGVRNLTEKTQRGLSLNLGFPEKTSWIACLTLQT
jgi:hypothetical protein